LEKQIGNEIVEVPSETVEEPVKEIEDVKEKEKPKPKPKEEIKPKPKEEPKITTQGADKAFHLSYLQAINEHRRKEEEMIKQFFSRSQPTLGDVKHIPLSALPVYLSGKESIPSIVYDNGDDDDDDEEEEDEGYGENIY
jgi:outer membrane biosynthesis protein TonB